MTCAAVVQSLSLAWHLIPPNLCGFSKYFIVSNKHLKMFFYSIQQLIAQSFRIKNTLTMYVWFFLLHLQVQGFWNFAMIYRLVDMKMCRWCGKCLEGQKQSWSLLIIPKLNVKTDHFGGSLYGQANVLLHPSTQILQHIEIERMRTIYISSIKKRSWLLENIPP